MDCSIEYNIDVIYIGTYDLSQSLGVTDDLYNPKLMKILEKTIMRIADARISAGVLAQSKKDAETWINMGVQFIPLKADVGLIYSSVKNQFDELKNIK